MNTNEDDPDQNTEPGAVTATRHGPAHDDMTTLVHAGRVSSRFGGLVNTPVCRGSTMITESFDQWEASKRCGNPYSHYGRFGTATTRSLESALKELDGADETLIFPSGLSACTHSLLAFVSTDDHVLLSDNIYGPTRMFAEGVLRRMAIDVDYFDPLNPDELRQRMNERTRVVFAESPGSLTFEVSDIPELARVTHQRDAVLIIDNTWASPLYFKPFAHGVDVSVQALTKYVVGHSDALLGAASTTARHAARLESDAHHFGETASPDDIYLALRGLRSMGVRLRQHGATGLLLARAMQRHPAVRRVLHPALPDDPGHALWTRDFSGTSGLFGAWLAVDDAATLRTFFDSLKLFAIGLSWGGFESLVLPVGQPTRTLGDAARRPTSESGRCGYLIRVHAGLEAPDDLLADMMQALDRCWERHAAQRSVSPTAAEPV